MRQMEPVNLKLSQSKVFWTTRQTPDTKQIKAKSSSQNSREFIRKSNFIRRNRIDNQNQNDPYSLMAWLEFGKTICKSPESNKSHKRVSDSLKNSSLGSKVQSIEKFSPKMVDLTSYKSSFSEGLKHYYSNFRLRSDSRTNHDSNESSNTQHQPFYAKKDNLNELSVTILNETKHSKKQYLTNSNSPMKHSQEAQRQEGEQGRVRAQGPKKLVGRCEYQNEIVYGLFNLIKSIKNPKIPKQSSPKSRMISSSSRNNTEDDKLLFLQAPIVKALYVKGENIIDMKLNKLFNEIRDSARTYSSSTFSILKLNTNLLIEDLISLNPLEADNARDLFKQFYLPQQPDHSIKLIMALGECGDNEDKDDNGDGIIDEELAQSKKIIAWRFLCINGKANEMEKGDWKTEIAKFFIKLGIMNLMIPRKDKNKNNNDCNNDYNNNKNNDDDDDDNNGQYLGKAIKAKRLLDNMLSGYITPTFSLYAWLRNIKKNKVIVDIVDYCCGGEGSNIPSMAQYLLDDLWDIIERLLASSTKDQKEISLLPSERYTIPSSPLMANTGCMMTKMPFPSSPRGYYTGGSGGGGGSAGSNMIISPMNGKSKFHMPRKSLSRDCDLRMRKCLYSPAKSSRLIHTKANLNTNHTITTTMTINTNINANTNTNNLNSNSYSSTPYLNRNQKQKERHEFILGLYTPKNIHEVKHITKQQKKFFNEYIGSVKELLKIKSLVKKKMQENV